MNKPKILVQVRGGLVVSVATSTECDVAVIDWDNEDEFPSINTSADYVETFPGKDLHPNIGSMLPWSFSRHDLAVGDIILATDPCVMDGTNQPSLTVGRHYQITQISKDGIVIVDDDGDDHHFQLSNLDEFFRV